jgi:hypothetical protein
MLESEMEDLLWRYPDKFLREPLNQFRRQPRSAVGRADLVFEDRLERLLVVEIKRGQLQRGAIDQVHDYFGMMKHEFPNKSVEMMVIAQSIPSERKVALDRYNIEYREIPEKRFRDVALEMGYLFESEQGSTSGSGPRNVVTLEPGPVVEVGDADMTSSSLGGHEGDISAPITTAPEVSAFFKEEQRKKVDYDAKNKALRYRVGSRIEWSVNIWKRFASVYQYRRFSGDLEFWRQRLSKPDTVAGKDSEHSLAFRLESKSDFDNFLAALAKPSAFEWQSKPRGR